MVTYVCEVAVEGSKWLSGKCCRCCLELACAVEPSALRLPLVP